MFAWWGRTVYQYRYIVIGVMVTLCLGGGLFSIGLGNHVTQSGFYDEGSQSVHASVISDKVYGRDRTSHVVAILTPPDGEKVTNPEWMQKVTDELNDLVADHEDQVVSWVGWLRAPDSTAETVQQMKTADDSKTFVSIPLKGDSDDEILKNYQAIAPDLKKINDGNIQLAGLNPLASELTGTIGEDQRRAEVAAIPLVCVVLFFVFGGVVAAALPGVIGGLTIAGALGILRILAEFMPVHFFALPVVTLMGLGIAVDYGLFMVSRFREEIAEGYDTESAVRRSVMTSGRTIMFSAVILVASALPLLLFPQGFLKSITYAIIASVMLAATLSITVLAAALGILGPRVDALGVRTLLRVPFFRNWKPMRVYLTWLAEKTQKTKTREEVEQGFWGKLVNRVMKRPGAFAVPIVIVMVLMIIPLGQLSLGGISEKYLPPNNSVRLAQENFDRSFPGFRTEPLTLVIESDDGSPISDQQMADIRAKAMTISGFTDPDNDPSKMWQERSVQEGGSEDSSVRVIQNGLINRNDAAEKIAALRSISAPRGITLSVGGTPALEQDSIHSLFEKLPLMVLLLITTTTILMFLAFGSVVLPIKAALMSALTLGSTMGVLTWMFVDGHGAGLMNYTPQPLMAPMIGLIIAVIWGLSTDYEVFLVSRMVEARERGMSTAESIRIGTATTGRLITGAALVLAVVAGAFVFSDLVMMKYLAFGLLIALLLDATVVRMFLVPAIMKMLGDDCWWAPRWMKQIQEKLGLGETELPDERKRPAVRDSAEAQAAALVGAGTRVPPRPRPPHDPTHPGAEAAGRAVPTRIPAAPPRPSDPSEAGTTRLPVQPPQTVPPQSQPPQSQPAPNEEATTTRLSAVKSAIRNLLNNAAAITNRLQRSASSTDIAADSAPDSSRPSAGAAPASTPAPAQGPPPPASPPKAAKPAKPREDREIESWLGELRGGSRGPGPGSQPTPSPQISDDVTRAIPTPGAAAGAEPADSDATTAIPVQRTSGQGDDAAEATTAINARKKKDSESTEKLNTGERSGEERQRRGGGVSAQDLLRREGRL